MPTITSAQTLLLGFIIAPSLFVLSAYFTRATRRRISSALVGAIAYGLANFLWDQLAFTQGWWTYPAFATTNLLPILYIPAGIAAGGAVGLIGWRVRRRFGMRGWALFLIIWSIWGVFHDYAGTAAFSSSNLLVFGPGAAPLFADLLVYGSCQALAQWVMQLVGGPASADALARSSKPQRSIIKEVVR